MSVNDTVKLLADCSRGAKMGLEAIDEALPLVNDPRMKYTLSDSKSNHITLGNEADTLLKGLNEKPGEPGAVAKGITWVKTNFSVAMNPGDSTVAGVITDGCNMGIKSINKALNEYSGADAGAKRVAKRLIDMEKKLVSDMSVYL